MKSRKLVLSTGNAHKVDEIVKILKNLNIEIFTKNQLGIEDFDIVEDGATLEENSIIKARALGNKLNFMVMADDTGLFVNALDGEPGLYSSRYAGDDHNDEKNNQKLLERLKNKEDRSAYFKTVIALITEDGEAHIAEGICNGQIATEKRGEGGFGYDPLFIPEGYDKTFAQLGQDVKNKISHRAKALYKFEQLLKNIIES